jgi:hypothetical protein
MGKFNFGFWIEDFGLNFNNRTYAKIAKKLNLSNPLISERLNSYLAPSPGD